MNLLLTGASGLLGRRIYQTLSREYTITTLGRTVCSPRHISVDLAHAVPVLPNQRFDLVVHAAGKANAQPRNAQERTDCQRVNVQGTAHLLAALDKLATSAVSVVHISSVMVYGCTAGHLLPETTPLCATDPYGRSKAEAERLMQDWAIRTDVRLAVLRLPPVVAEPLKGNLATLQTAIRRGYYFRIGEGLARRSMVWADDVAAVIQRAAGQGGVVNLTDGQHPSIRELDEAMAHRLGRSRPIPTLSVDRAAALARLGDGINKLIGWRFPFDTLSLQKLTHSLTYSDDLARRQLGWNPRPVLDVIR